MKNMESFQKERNKAVLWTIICMFGYCLLAVWENINMLEVMRVIFIFMWYLTMPLITVVSWGNCIVNYFRLEAVKEKRHNLSEYIWICLSIGSMVLLGIVTMCFILDFVNYVTVNWNWLKELYHCIGIKLGITLGWMICFLYSVVVRRRISFDNDSKRKITILFVGAVLVISLAWCVVMQKDYVNFETELVWVRNMREYYEEYGNDVGGVPFSKKYGQ